MCGPNHHHPIGFPEQYADFIHFHPYAQSTPVLQVLRLGGRRDRQVSRWLTLHAGFQGTHALLKVGRSALEEIDPAKETVGRRLLRCCDHRDGKGYQRRE